MNKSSYTRKRIFFTICGCLILATAFAQSGKLKRAQREMEQLNFVGAIDHYRQILKKDRPAEAIINLADCYRKINDWENAEYWYAQVILLPESRSVHMLHYGRALQQNGKCDEAQKWFERYVEEVPDDARGKHLVKACEYEEELRTKNAGLYHVKHVDFNSSMNDFCPAFYQDAIVFTSDRPPQSFTKEEQSWTGAHFLSLYEVTAWPSSEDGYCIHYQYGAPGRFSKDLSSPYHDAAISFSRNQTQAFLTHNNLKEARKGDPDNIVKLKVYTANSIGEGAWSKLRELPFNSDHYTVAHPAVTPGGERLFFASDMPGGYGGMDLYVSTFKDGQWGSPSNLGPAINTEGNEVFPYYHLSGRLYFSSDGQIGLGGLDLYYTDDLGDQQWGNIENLGYPLNSNSDDFGLILNDDGDFGYFSSNRPGGFGQDDIYSFCKVSSTIEFVLKDVDTSEPLSQVVITDAKHQIELITNTEGKVSFDALRNNCYEFRIFKDTYEPELKNVCTKPTKSTTAYEIGLKKEPVITYEGIVFDEHDLPLKGVSVDVQNDCGAGFLENQMTDHSGRYTFQARKSCCYEIIFSKPGYLGQSLLNQCTYDITQDTKIQHSITLMPLNDIYAIGKFPEQRQDEQEELVLNAPSEKELAGEFKGYDRNKASNGIPFEVSPGVKHQSSEDPLPYLLPIQFEPDKLQLKKNSLPQLEELYQFLLIRPEVRIEIGVHTDSRGTAWFNDQISRHRADAVVKWLLEKGIDPRRVIPKGYGESRPVIDCGEKVPCTDSDHRINNRAEFKILPGT